MLGPMAIVRSSIQRHSLLTVTPLQVYTIACRYHWFEAAQAASIHCLSYDLTDINTIVALRGVSITDYGRLLELARARSNIFRRRLDDPVWFTGSVSNHACLHCGAITGDLTWKVLRMKLAEEFERCPGGNTICKELMEWPEWKACMSAFHCIGHLHFGTVPTRSAILRALEGLPESLNCTPSSTSDLL